MLRHPLILSDPLVRGGEQSSVQKSSLCALAEGIEPDRLRAD
jgi:hypothetical protein